MASSIPMVCFFIFPKLEAAAGVPRRLVLLCSVPANGGQNDQGCPCHKGQNGQLGQDPLGVLVVRDFGQSQGCHGGTQNGGDDVGQLVAVEERLNANLQGYAQHFTHGLQNGTQDGNFGGSRGNKEIDKGDDDGHANGGNAGTHALQGLAGVVDNGVHDVATEVCSIFSNPSLRERSPVATLPRIFASSTAI